MENDNVYTKQFHVQLGNRIRELRKLNNYSIEELAAIADIHNTYLGQIERGVANASVSTLLKISRSLNVNLVDLLSFQEIKIQNTDKEKLIFQVINELITLNLNKIKLSLELTKLVSKY